MACLLILPVLISSFNAKVCPATRTSARSTSTTCATTARVDDTAQATCHQSEQQDLDYYDDHGIVTLL